MSLLAKKTICISFHCLARTHICIFIMYQHLVALTEDCKQKTALLLNTTSRPVL